MITKIQLYNAPYEMNSLDRFYKDIDTKLVKHYVGEIKDFSHQISSTTEMEVTFNDAAGRGSYMAIESTIFKNKTISYWFLTAITELESDEGTRYKATLDAIATFGEEVFSRLDGKKIKVDRLHEDRYILSGGNFNLNKKHHGLINTDFKVGDTKGVELVYDGAEEENSGGASIIDLYDFWESDAEDGTIEGVEYRGGGGYSRSIQNVINSGNKKYHLYALIQILGSPKIYEQYIPFKDNTQADLKDGIIREKSSIRNTIIIPVDIRNKENNFNTISILSRLQNNKILNIIKLPYQLDLKDGFQIIFDEAGKRYSTSQTSGTNDFALIDEELNKVNLDGIRIFPDNINLGNGGKKQVYELYAYNKIKSFNDENIISIPTSKLDTTDIMDFIANTKTPAEMKRIVDAGETERLEIALLNSQIMPIEMHFHDNKTILDFYNFANKVDKTHIKGSYVFNEMGTEVTLKISENQFAGWSENVIMSFATDQGSSYLATHKSRNDAQKKSIDLQAQQAGLQAHLQKLQGSAQAGNVVADVFSLGANIAQGVYQRDYAGKIEDLQPKIADAKKGEIQGAINDASATAPSMHIGSSHNLIDLNTQETKHNFNWIMKKPNKFLRDKMVEFFDRHGYLFHDWMIFSKGMVENRSRFNFIEMDEFKDFLGTFDDFDINVLQLLDAEFKKGLRLWHIDDIDYSAPNLEKVITENI